MGASNAHEMVEDLFADVPTKDLVPPSAADVPMHVLSNTLAIRGIRRDLRRASRWFAAMMLAFLGGSLGLGTTVLWSAFHAGERNAELDGHTAQITELAARTARLEEKAMRDRSSRDGRE